MKSRKRLIPTIVVATLLIMLTGCVDVPRTRTTVHRDLTVFDSIHQLHCQPIIHFQHFAGMTPECKGYLTPGTSLFQEVLIGDVSPGNDQWCQSHSHPASEGHPDCIIIEAVAQIHGNGEYQ